MEARNEDTERLAHYLNQLVFCLYSEDAGLLPEGLFTRIVAQHYREPTTFDEAIRSLFRLMATGGHAGADQIAQFNGDLFNVVDTVELSTVALQRLGEACDRNWRDIEPSIFGTLFERALDASKRAQTGAHYTGADDIELVVEPVVMTPLRREWQETRAAIDNLLDSEQESNAAIATTQRTGFEPLTALATALRTTAREQLDAFRQRLASVKVLDPACGSGNFLYIALRSLLDLEQEVIDFAAVHGWHGLTPSVQPDQMLGLEINHYAAGTGTDGAVDRLYSVAPRQRLPLHTATATDPAGYDTADRRNTGPNRPRQSGGTGMAGGGVHRGQPAVFGTCAFPRDVG